MPPCPLALVVAQSAEHCKAAAVAAADAAARDAADAAHGVATMSALVQGFNRHVEVLAAARCAHAAATPVPAAVAAAGCASVDGILRLRRALACGQSVACYMPPTA